MASGTLGQSSLSATTDTVVYTVPSSKVASMSINLVNRTGVAVTVRLAVAANTTPTNAEYLEYDATIPANGVLERTGIVASANKKIVAYASAASVSINVYGFEEDA